MPAYGVDLRAISTILASLPGRCHIRAVGGLRRKRVRNEATAPALRPRSPWRGWESGLHWHEGMESAERGREAWGRFPCGWPWAWC